MSELFHPPVKRSVEIAGHKTSISLEPLFWELLRNAAKRRSLPLNALVAQIDADRITASHPPGLGTAIRLWLVADLVRHLAHPGAAAGPQSQAPKPEAPEPGH